MSPSTSLLRVSLLLAADGVATIRGVTLPSTLGPPNPAFGWLRTTVSDASPSGYFLFDEKAEFDALVGEWRATRSRITSSPAKLAANPAYRRIVAKGAPAIPFILRELERELDYWFLALMEITGENPVPHEKLGNLPAMREAWIQWGRGRGFI